MSAQEKKSGASAQRDPADILRAREKFDLFRRFYNPLVRDILQPSDYWEEAEYREPVFPEDNWGVSATWMQSMREKKYGSFSWIQRDYDQWKRSLGFGVINVVLERNLLDDTCRGSVNYGGFEQTFELADGEENRQTNLEKLENALGEVLRRGGDLLEYLSTYNE